MPIYEYYCARCNGKFRHLARHIDARAPACPRCGYTDVARMISKVNAVHSSDYHESELRQGAGAVDHQNPEKIAQFLKKSGRIEDATGVYGSRAYRELLDRRANGASDADLTDLVDDLTAEMLPSPAAETAGAVVFSKQMGNRMAAEGPPEPDETAAENQASEGKRKDRKKNKPVDLGWS
ncbi:MAG: zinc ribbon domain-containing protein [Anaerolineae bacterium]|nr:zinc ribbon domain-containing protein [Anaerolineae bacterium]